ncbi:LGFP repeat-containing protein [Corynebacterium glutamicum]|uniref:LGFP repeat-containing protein n=1 Tax=Corynebacterium glutamicum TaxID=1718 RepID=UPI000B34BBD1|nr:LGFP repeat-containing protein [Corynebacterium glutamicum]
MHVSTLPNKKLRTRIFAGTAAVALSLGVASCSNAEDAVDSATDAANSATSAAGSAINDATGTSSASTTEPSGTSESDSGSDSAGGDTTEVESADGSTISIPTAVVTAANAAGFSTPESVEEGPNGESLVTFPEGYVVNSAEGGAQALVGMIGETWIGEGGLSAAVGLPTGPEEATTNGWTQQFTSGVISWLDDGSGQFAASVEPA